VEIAADSTVPAIVRATAVALAGGFPRSAVGQVVERAVQDPDPLVRLAAPRAAASRGVPNYERIVTALLYDSIRAVRSEAVQALSTVIPGDIPPEHTEAYAFALNEYRGSLELHADRPESRLSLALIEAAAGRYAEAERQLRTAVSLDPRFVPAYVNLADLLRAQGRDAEGEGLLLQGLQFNPGAAALHHALGLLLVRLERRDEAMAQLSTAAELSPESPRYVYTYAIGLHSAGFEDEALAVLAEAARRHPYDIDILTALVSFNADAGRRVDALEYAERLANVNPENASFAEWVKSLGTP
jgi:tetratricopeptide (TPR) repeat protein